MGRSLARLAALVVGLRFEGGGTYPDVPVVGQLFFDTTTHLPYIWDGSAWT